MRPVALAVVIVAACGGGKKQAPDTQGSGSGSGSGMGSDAGMIDGPALIACTPTSGTTMSTRMIGKVNGTAILATSPPNDGRLFVIEQDGAIRIFENETLKPNPFIDVHAKIYGGTGSEQGLLGLAFHPQYWRNNYFYVWYTALNPNTADTANPYVDVLERYTASSTDLNTADANSGQIILSIPDFASNHNGGMLEFGSDGYLYVGTGDGGAGGDPHHNAQNLDPASADCVAAGNLCQTMLGKILRIDVDHPANGKMYGIPADNPFKTTPTPEAYMIGVRNPWRWSFDRKTGDMWIADVGQNIWEELDAIPAGQQAGLNLGWSMYEGQSCYGNYSCDTTGKFMPQFVINHSQGWAAIIGGQVYRGPCYPDLTGYYFYSDNAAHLLYRTKWNGTGIDTPVDVSPAAGFPAGPASIHADARGELYETTVDGYVYHLEAGP